MGVRLYLAGFDIRSIDTYHETSAEPSRSPGYDGIASRYLLPVHTRSTPEGAKSVDFVTKSAPHTSSTLQLAGLEIISIAQRHNTSAEPSRSPGYDGITSRCLLPVHTRSPAEGAKSADIVMKSAPHTSLGLQLAGLDIISIESRHETSAEPSTSPGDDGITSRYLLPVFESISPQGV